VAFWSHWHLRVLRLRRNNPLAVTIRSLRFTRHSRGRDPSVLDGAPDYRPAAVAVRQAKVAEFRRRLAAIPVSSWPVSQRVDYLVVQARLNALDFQFRVQHPWISDPGFYTEAVERVAYAELPVKGDALTALQGRLNAVPNVLAQAKTNLIEPAAEYAKLTIHDINTADGVGHACHFRTVPGRRERTAGTLILLSVPKRSNPNWCLRRRRPWPPWMILIHG